MSSRVRGVDTPLAGPVPIAVVALDLVTKRYAALNFADGPVEAAAVHHNDLNHLLQQRSDIGVVLFRNLATGLSNKLSRTDAFLSVKPWE